MLPPELLLIIINFAIGLIITISLNIEVGFLNIPQFGRLLAVVMGAIIAAAVPGRILAAIMGYPWGAEYADHMYNFRIVSEINKALVADPLLSIGIFLLTLVIAAAVGGLIGLLCAYPALRLKETLGIVLLAFGDLAVTIAWNYEPIVGGTTGVFVIDPFIFVGTHLRFTVAALVVLLAALAVYAYAELLARSPYGRMLKAIRDAEIAAGIYGKDAVKARKQVLVIGGAISAIAGALWAFFTGSMKAVTYTRLQWTFWPWAFMMLGGVGNNFGVLVGVLIYTVARFLIIVYKGVISAVVGISPEWLEYILVGLLIVVIMLFRPQGLFPEKPVYSLPKRRIHEIISRVERESGSQTQQGAATP
jgi:branched-chain amino acid transport system permease protein